MKKPDVKPNSALRLSIRIWQGFTLQLFLFAVLPLTALVLLVTFGSLRLHHNAMRSLVADRNLRAVQSAATSLSKEISHRAEILELLSRYVGEDAPGESFLNLAAEDLAVFEGGVMLVDSQGNIRSQVGESAVQTLVAQSEWETLQSAIESDSPGTARFLPAQTIAGQRYVPAYVNVVGGNFLIGLFSPDQMLAESLANVSNEASLTTLVVDHNFQILYQSGRLTEQEAVRSHPGIQSALDGLSQIDYLPTTDGEHVIASSPVQPVNWALMIEESWEDITSPLLQLTQNAPLIIIPILVFALLALWFGLRQIVEPMQALEGKAGALARGDFEAIRQPVGGVPEIRRLQQTLAEMAGQLKNAQKTLHSYVGAITDSVESERRNLARELHDETLQSLIALGQYTQYALHWNQDERVEKTLNQIMDLAEDGMKNLRRMVRGLRPIYIEDLGLATALKMQASNSDGTNEVQVHFLQEGKERRVKPEIEMAFYRMAQEALSNVRRHAGARNAWVTITFRKAEIVLEVRDDGKGFQVPPDPLQYARQGHYGLLSLYERAELLGAKLIIQSSDGEGTLIRVKLPLNEETAIAHE